MIDTSTHLMELALRNTCKENENIGVLDVRNSNLLLFDGRPIAKAMIDAELAYVSSIWESA